MTVQELIEYLNKIEDKSLEVVYITQDGFIDIGLVTYSKMFDSVVLSQD